MTLAQSDSRSRRTNSAAKAPVRKFPLSDALEFLASPEAKKNDQKRYAAQHGLVDALETSEPDENVRAKALDILAQAAKNETLGHAVTGRIKKNAVLNLAVFGANG